MSRMINFSEIKTDVVGCVFNAEAGLCMAGQEIKGKVYYFKKIEGMDLKIGDTVVVHCSTGFQLATVERINVMDANNQATKYVVGKVDLEAYVEFMKKEEEKKAMAAMLMQKKKELEGELGFQLLAEKNPEFAAMWDAFKAMGGKIG